MIYVGLKFSHHLKNFMLEQYRSCNIQDVVHHYKTMNFYSCRILFVCDWILI